MDEAVSALQGLFTRALALNEGSTNAFPSAENVSEAQDIAARGRAVAGKALSVDSPHLQVLDKVYVVALGIRPGTIEAYEDWHWLRGNLVSALSALLMDLYETARKAFIAKSADSRVRQELETLIEEVSKLVNANDSTRADALKRRTVKLAAKVFGPFDELGLIIEEIDFPVVTSATLPQGQYEKYLRGRQELLNGLYAIQREVDAVIKTVHDEATTTRRQPSSKRIFVVHGHDDGMKHVVARVLEKLDLQPIILHEQPNEGRTIVEKFSDYADVGFAVVLVSPDDKGFVASGNPKTAKFRARQNVIFEMGFFIGKLGREKVAALQRQVSDFEILSDYSGVLYLPYDGDEGSWRLKLVRELQAQGYDVDANKLTRGQ